MLIFKLITSIEELILTETSCVLCNSYSKTPICEDCYKSLNKIRKTHCCLRCLAYLPPKELICTNCIENQFVFNRVYAPFSYQEPLKTILHQLKYNSQLQYAKSLSYLFYKGFNDLNLKSLPDYLIPIPLHPIRQHKRGFNQVDELLKDFQIQYKLPVLKAIRVKNTQSQMTLSRSLRLANLNNSFKFDYELKGAHIAIVDDVLTTGTTANELAKILLNLGAKKVDVWVFMRAITEAK